MWGLFNYAPIAHYDKLIEEKTDNLDVDEMDDGELLTDGGRKYFYVWRTENGNYLFDAEVNGDAADVAKESVEDAEQMLETLFDTYPEEKDRYKRAACYKIKVMDKVLEGVEVETEQSGLGDFSTDGGYDLPAGYDHGLAELAEEAPSLHW